MIALPMPGKGMPYSLGYAALDRDGVHILDPGWHGRDNLRVWEEFLLAHGRTLQDVVGIIATHGHPDHVGLAATLSEVSDAKISMSSTEAKILGGEVQAELGSREAIGIRLEQWGVPGSSREQLSQALLADVHPHLPAPSACIEHGDRIDFGGTWLSAIHTPGHTGGHMCFVAHDQQAIFTGDHVLPRIAPGMGLGILPGSDPMNDYMTSLYAMSEFEQYEVLAGHEYRFRGISAASARIASHHLKKSRALREIARELGDATVWEYAEHVPWSRGWENLSGFMLHAALTQTELHLKSLRSGALDRWLDGSWPVQQ